MFAGASDSLKAMVEYDLSWQDIINRFFEVTPKFRTGDASHIRNKVYNTQKLVRPGFILIFMVKTKREKNSEKKKRKKPSNSGVVSAGVGKFICVLSDF